MLDLNSLRLPALSSYQALMHLSMLSPRGVRLPTILDNEEGLEINLQCNYCTLMCRKVAFTRPRVAAFDTFGQLCCPVGGEFDSFFQNMSKSPPHVRPTPLGPNIVRRITWSRETQTLSLNGSRNSPAFNVIPCLNRKRIITLLVF